MSNMSSCSTTDFASRSIAKLRRLKIQESVLFSSIENTLLSLEQDKIMDFQKHSDYKNFELCLKDSFIEIRNLLEDIKITIKSYKNIEHLDINGIKKEVLDLEAKFKSFKIHLQTELAARKNRANEIEHELKTKKVMEYQGKNKTRRPPTKQFSEITPSPVKAIINSPFKCPEVQTFQDFLKQNHHRYGGWNEYNHNKFVRIWNKYFNNDNSENSIKSDDFNENSEEFKRFQKEVLDNIAGITFDDVTSHSKWYYEYQRLKNLQQKAIDRWKENIRKIKKPNQEVKQKPQLNNSSACNTRAMSRENQLNRSKNISDPNIMSRIVRSTEQWKNRCRDNKNPPQLFPIPHGDGRQARIPTWRLGLLDI